MVVIKFETEKMNKGQFFVFPTVLVDSSEKAAKARISICFTWLRGLFAIGVKWTRKEKIAAKIGQK